MSLELAIALVILVTLVISVFAGVVILNARSRRPAPVVGGPEYKHNLGQVQYIGQSTPNPRQPPQITERIRSHEDSRRNPLPRCASCGVALAFGDATCPKCGKELRPWSLKR